MILKTLDEATAEGATQSAASKILGLDPRTPQRWRALGVKEDCRHGPNTVPKNKLSDEERNGFLKTANSPELRDLSPKQIVPTLASRSVYVASESTLYRILREEDQLNHRERSRPAVNRHKPDALVATAPNQTWSWDITYLKSPVRGMFFYLYLVMDVWSRKIVGWEVYAEESSQNASKLMAETYRKEGVTPGSLVIHMDNGGPMKGATLLSTLQKLGVATSFSRPSASNDNPYSESLFRTMKYRPAFPSGVFESINEAKRWVAQFAHWYNTAHLHSAIRFVTPNDRHCGRDIEILKHRKTAYADARARHPERWSRNTRNWNPIQQVVLNPNQVPIRHIG